MAATLARLTGKKIETKYTLDPALLGGAVVTDRGHDLRWLVAQPFE